MHARAAAALILAVVLAGCRADVTTPTSEPADPMDTDARVAGEPSASQVTCLTCTFEPRLYTRQAGIPVTELVEFPGNPAGAYTIEISDLGSRGANASVELNGEPLNVRSGSVRQEVVLDWENTLRVRLTGKPGSQLGVRVFQEIVSVKVTPEAPRSRMAATLQFTAAARDRNGVEVPRQTFTWESRDTTIATIDAATGLATTTGPVHSTIPWRYTTISTGEGPVTIVARVNGMTDLNGFVTWRVVAGFVYTTFRAPLPVSSPNRTSRALPEAIRYDVARLESMAATCVVESAEHQWRSQLLEADERRFKRCYPQLEHETPTRLWIPPTPFTDGFYLPGSDSNVGLYGRYCGAGHPDGPWMDDARNPGYQPKDPIDAMCMEHDRSLDNHELDPTFDALQAGCILRYGIETELLHEEGGRVMPGTARWNAFWAEWPAMKVARDHWVTETNKICVDPIYYIFLSDRGLII